MAIAEKSCELRVFLELRVRQGGEAITLASAAHRGGVKSRVAGKLPEYLNWRDDTL
jgi:hypothetical protein